MNEIDLKKAIIDYTNWLLSQNLQISENSNGISFRSDRIGGKIYSPEDLYDYFLQNSRIGDILNK